MPDFSVILVGGVQTPWTDAASSNPIHPSRVNPNPAHLHTYRRVQLPSELATVVLTAQAVVGGVVAPIDGALGGRLFEVAWPEFSVSPPMTSQAVGQSSLITITITSAHQGHFLLSVRRPLGGSVNVPFYVEL